MREEPHPAPVPPSAPLQPAPTLLQWLGLIALACLLVFNWRSCSHVAELEQLQRDQGYADQQELKLELDTAAKLREEERQRALAEQELARGRVKRLTDNARRLKEQAIAWEKESQELLSGNGGRAIAADESLVAQFQAVLSQERPDQEVARLIAAAEQLRAVVHSKDDNAVPFKPSEGWYFDVEQLDGKVTQAASAFKEQLRQLAALQAQAGTSEERSPLPLKDAIAKLQAKWDAEQLVAVERAVAEARQQGLEKLAREKAEAQRIMDEAEAERVRIEGEIAAKKVRDAAEDARREEAVRQERLAAAREKAQRELAFAKALPEIKELLVPFFSLGYTQPQSGAFKRMTTEKQPVSLSRMKGEGLLEDTVDALTDLHYMATGNGANDRPAGAFPPYGTTVSGGKERIKRAQDLLNLFGELMVEKGMLAP